MGTPAVAGQLIKDYELLETLGAGRSGTIYRAYQSTMGREVALRRVLPSLANDPDFIRHFEQAAQAIARLEHLHIVPLYDYWRDQQGTWLVSRWMRGGALSQAIQQEPYGLEPACLLLDQIASGLAFAHGQGVIHGELRSSNVLLDEDGNGHLADFRLAVASLGGKARGAGSKRPPNRLENSSPEESRGEQPTPQSDIYALGVLLYEVLTGQHPFDGLPPVQRLFAQLNESLPELRGLGAEVGNELNAVIQKATAKNPKARYQNVLEMAAAIRTASGIDKSPVDPHEELTLREEEILDRIVAGQSNKEIAQDLYVELTTVKWHITQMYRKLGVRSRKQAIARADRARSLAKEPAGLHEADRDSLRMPAPINPYKGLRAFDTNDARDFFGREATVDQLVERLASGTPGGAMSHLAPRGQGRFIAIVGPSGSGKSSLVKAGLLPALRQGRVPGSERWFIAHMVPGSRPLDQLEVALSRIAADQTANIRGHLDRDVYGLGRVADLILPRDKSELLVVVDQFEELFTLSDDEAARSQFLALLAEAVQDVRSRVRIVIMLRADYYDKPLHYPGFAELMSTHLETLLPLSRVELERAVVGPAERVGVKYEPGLVTTVVDEVQYQPGALPLLQFALTELFEGRQGMLLTHAAYQSLGGIIGALARRAEELFWEHDTAGREATRQLFLRLVSMGEDSEFVADARRRVFRSDLMELSGDDELVDELIDAYAAYRLLTLDHDPRTRLPTVELAHEALLMEWGRLRDWVDESRTDLRLQQQLARASLEWSQADRDPSFALYGSRLEQFLNWSDSTDLVLTEGEKAYLQSSAALRDQLAASDAARLARERILERRSQKLLRTIAIISVLAALVSSWLAWNAIRQRVLAELHVARSESQRIAAEANSILDRGGSPELASLLSLQALKASYSFQADTALQRAGSIRIESVLIDAPGGAFWPMLSPDKRFLRFMRDAPDGSGSMITELWDLHSMEQLWQVRDFVMLGFPWTQRDFTPDYSNLVAVTSSDRELVLLSADSGLRTHTFDSSGSVIVHYQLSADGEFLVAGMEDGWVYVWNTHTGERLLERSVGESGFTRFEVGRMLLVAISSDSRKVAAMAAGTTHVWSLADGEELHRIEHDHEGISPPQFLAADQLLLAAIEPVLSLWDLSTGMELPHNLPPGAGLLSPDGLWFAQGGQGDGRSEIIIWEVGSGRELHRLRGHSDDAWPVQFSKDSRQLLSASDDGSARLWDITEGTDLIQLAGHTQPVQGAYLSGDGQMAATAGREGVVRVWDLMAPLHIVTRVPGLRDFFSPAPDGRTAITAADGGTGIKVLDWQAGQVNYVLDSRRPVWRGGISSFPFSDDGDQLLRVTDLGSIAIYDVEHGELLEEFTNLDGVFRYASFVPGRQEIFASGDRGGYLLSAKDGELLNVFEAPGTFLNGNQSGFLAVSNDGRLGAMHLWTRDLQHVVYVWNLRSGRLVFRSAPEPNDVVFAIDFSQDGRYLAWGGTANVVRVVDLSTGGTTITLEQRGTVEAIDFSADNGWLLVSADNLHLWDLGEGEIVRRFNTGLGPGRHASFEDDDRTVWYSLAEDGSIHRQPIRLDLLIDSVCAWLVRDLTAQERLLYDLGNQPSCPKFADA